MNRTHHTPRRIASACGLALACAPAALAASDDLVAVQSQDAISTLTLDGAPFRSTPADVVDLRAVAVPGSDAVLVSWTERTASGTVGYSAVARDGRSVDRVSVDGDTIRLRYAEFDPGRAVPAVPAMLAADEQHDAYIVQYIGQPVAAADAALEDAGAIVVRHLADHARIVRMDDAARDRVADLDIVRWVGPFHPAYKLDEPILQQFVLGGGVSSFVDPPVRYSIELFEDGPEAMLAATQAVAQAGGAVDLEVPETGRLEASLTQDQLLSIVRLGNVHFVDHWAAPETDMNIARSIGGAAYLDSVAGYTGAGVSGEVMDSGILRTHQEFQDPPPVLHTGTGVDSHGTATYSIVFADGVSPAAKGMLPDGRGIFASYFGLGNRYVHTRELVIPTGTFRAVFQSNSWGSGLTTSYSTTTSEMDRIIFDNDILITQSQSNQGSRQSRPQAWAKNIVSVGGVVHRNTLSKSDDCWCSGASIGPASDGRIKPDLTHFYEFTRAATSASTGAYTEFGGTSGATPIVAGHFGLFFQMWADGIFGNPVSGGDVFDERARFSTAKAMMINTADPYAFSSPSSDKSRVKQGWGMPDLREMYDGRESFFVVDETDILEELDTATYPLVVPAGEDQLRVTLTWSDPNGTTSSTVHRINNLDLRVTAPDGSVYWGNVGLDTGIWSDPGGSANNVDTVENVFVQSPEAGTWTVEVIAAEINRDGHRETPIRDVDFALVAQGVDGLAAAFELPFEDQVPDADVDREKWIELSGSIIATTLGFNPPSEPYSILIANEPLLASNRINVPLDLSPNVDVSFWSEHRGVEAGETLVAEYFSTFFDEWRELTTVVSDGSDQTEFVQHTIDLPLDGYGETFRLRFRAPGSDATDQWYIDDVFVGEPDSTGCRADFDGDGALTIFDFLAFQNAFDSGDLAADFDGDGALTIFDFLAFQNEFDAGCP
ncbi:MAG: GC-type dockerin domain-anchored protein [Planctomycetota bacterium]